MSKVIEIERKFLVKPEMYDFIKKEADWVETITQGYICKNDIGSLRIRMVERKKGGYGHTKSIYLMGKLKQNDPMVNEEVTLNLQELDSAKILMEAFSPNIIVKERYYIEHERYFWSVDFFEKSGLVLAELEIPEITTVFPLPPWVDKEVTGQPEYYNANMS